MYIVKSIECMTVNGTGQVLVCGGRSGSVIFRSIWDLGLLRTIDLSSHGPVTALWFTEGEGKCSAFCDIMSCRVITCLDVTQLFSFRQSISISGLSRRIVFGDH
jgi:hypothetical protein